TPHDSRQSGRASRKRGRQHGSPFGGIGGMKAIAPVLLGLGLTAAIYGATIADAAESRDLNTLRALLKPHADVNAAQPDGTTALHWAAHWNDLASVNLLLQAGANPKASNRYGATPLSEAAGAGNAAMIEALVKSGADIKTPVTKDGETVLMTAARAGNV